MPGGKPFPELRALKGTVIDGRYKIGDLLGTGGMGAVYEALQLRLDRRVAIKILNPVYMHREDYVARFLREAKAASKIRHANVVQMMDFGELPNGSVYSVMEFLEGRDLAEVLQKETRIAWPRARALMLQIARGLRAAHEQGVIHRDIKPANLFLVMRQDDEGGQREVLKILDFGIARVQSQPSQNTSALTGTAELLGTPSYMAPELARGRSANPRSECYSVGVVAYRMLSGRLPFEGETAFDVLFRSATEQPTPLRAHDPTIPEAIDQLIMRMIAREPEHRFDQMVDLVRAITAVDDFGRLDPMKLNATGPHATVPGAAAIAQPVVAPGYHPPAVTAPVAGTPLTSVPTGVMSTTQPTPSPAADLGSGPIPGPPSPATLDPKTGPAVVVPPPLSSDSMAAAAAAARAGNTASIKLPTSPMASDSATAPTHMDPLTPTSGSGLQRLPTAMSERTNPGVYEPTPGSMKLPLEPAAGSTVAIAGLDVATGTGAAYDSLTGEVPRRDSKLLYIGGGVVLLLMVIVGAIAMSGGDDAKDTDKSTKAAMAPDEPKAPAKAEPGPVDETATPTTEPATPTHAPDTSPTSMDDGEAGGDGEPTIVIEDTDPGPSPTVKPKPAPRPKPVPTPEVDPGKKPSAGPSKPASSNSDKARSAVTKKLKKQVLQSCGKFTGGKSYTVKFAVGENGKTLMVRTGAPPVLDGCVKKEIATATYPVSDRMYQEQFKL